MGCNCGKKAVQVASAPVVYNSWAVVQPNGAAAMFATETEAQVWKAEQPEGGESLTIRAPYEVV